MNNEIKEILEDVKRHLDYVEATKQCSIRDNEMKAMYDYITNLQEEIDKLTAESTNFESKFYEMQDNFSVANDEIKNLQEENEIVHKDFDKLSEKYFFEKTRNEKAIEILENNKVAGSLLQALDQIESILKGSEESELD